MTQRAKYAWVCFAAFLSFKPILHADEGMWLPYMLEQLNEADLKKNGFKLKAEDIYSINHTSMKDAVVQLSSGCTGELISGKGLLLTNHHCGYAAIQSHSALGHDYLTNGFWAMKPSEELPNPGFTVTFILSMEDVTEKVLKNVNPSMSENARDSVIRRNGALIGKEMVTGTRNESFIRAFFNGNQYILFITQTFRDIRLVGAPPSSIGKFGSDADNWVWPRHTGDFSMFRIYANKNNEPAEYSPDNIPYTPKYFFPISLKGEKEGDFTLVYGFPGRTSEYLQSEALNIIQNVSDPVRVSIRDTRLAIMDEDMRASNIVRIQYAAKQSGVANGWKKWKGEMYGLQLNNAIQKRKEYENEFQLRVNAKPEFQEKYGNLIRNLQSAYDSLKPVQLCFEYYNEVAGGIELIKYAQTFEALYKASVADKPDVEEIKKLINIIQSAAGAFYKDYNLPTDEKICAALLKIYYNGLPKEKQPDIFRLIESKYKSNFEKYSAEIYSRSIFASAMNLDKFLKTYKASDSKKLRKDPVYKLMQSIYGNFHSTIAPIHAKLTERIAILNRAYMQAQREIMTARKYYPDANSTLRVSFGNVGSYSPRDGVSYNWYTTIDGIMQKEDPNVDEFHVAPKLKELWMKKDYGQYADEQGKLHVAFIANNHTSGGNSGSPVIDADGNLIGTNFDRCWEGTMSDEAFDPSFCRNISVDVRYTLFVIDKYAGAGYLLNEMKLVR
jgi:hypothetical protein